MDFLIVLDTIVLVVVALALWAVVEGQNVIKIRLDRLERQKGFTPPQCWEAELKKGTIRTRRMIVASSESDAVRQLLQWGFGPGHIRALRRMDGPNPSGGSGPLSAA
jgi:hypothetical protein